MQSSPSSAKGKMRHAGQGSVMPTFSRHVGLDNDNIRNKIPVDVFHETNYSTLATSILSQYVVRAQKEQNYFALGYFS
jgi:hypothetical protein